MVVHGLFDELLAFEKVAVVFCLDDCGQRKGNAYDASF